MREGALTDLPPDDAARLNRWHAAGRPPVPVIIDTRGTVHATTINLATVLRGRDPRWRLFRDTAVNWLDMSLPADRGTT